MAINSSIEPVLRLLRRFRPRWLEGMFVRPNPDALFVLGNQKSGTTAIAALLSRFAGLSATLDIDSWTVEEQDSLHNGELSIEEFVGNHRVDFSKQIIKEPALTFLYDQLRNVFPMEKVIFIVRDPRSNIRSILNRVNVSGERNRIDGFDELPLAWQRIVDNRWMGLKSGHYVDSLAERWNVAADIYKNYSQEMLLVRYEDFLLDKIGTIKRVAGSFDLEEVADISEYVDIQYQPPGNSSIAWVDFFGLENLNRIVQLCGERMEFFGYGVECE